ncbi:SMC-Scp complex subunit ScpB [Bacillus sp. FJAT-42376]|uniref:SMC-Scp complex subunit ScpB n=1 Tax=Bacillus sp. FJAT-42376 TaxID=2014076 RepID=UPI000F4E7547|nr:SMC-Scp complex subunit ScpB [Bacillus sp. FJAT-42376]AZB43391.1 SMC-Scp complex subunit ScpB [Bacillus sp. FJAT-42376]
MTEIIQWKSIVEALLFAAGDEGLSLKQLMNVLDVEEPIVKDIMEDLSADYRNENRGIEIAEVANVFQLTTKKEHAPYLKKLVESPGSQSLSQAALETLAIVAYRQPLTRIEIEEVRGVKTERPLQTLVSKALIKEVGRAEGTGRAILYGTTSEFLEYFGLKSIGDLPPLPEDGDEGEQDEADLFFEKFSQTMDDLN